MGETRKSPARTTGDPATIRDHAWAAPTTSWPLRYGGASAIVAACTGVAALLSGRFELSDLTMVYLLGSVGAAVAFGRGAAIFASILSVAAFNYIFVPPRFSFEVEDAQYIATFGVMLTVAVVTGTLTARLREQLALARFRERRTAALYRLSHELISRSLPSDVLEIAVRRIGDVLNSRVAVVGPAQSPETVVLAGDPAVVGPPAESAAARRVFDDGQIAGLEHVGSVGVLHMPLEAGFHRYGVMSVEPIAGSWSAERFQLFRVLVSQTALALERCRLANEVHAARSLADTERSRNALLSSVSHDLRTPLAAITGAATNLRDGSAQLADATRRELADMIAEEAQRLNRLIGNILDMTRLESGMLRVRRDWHSLEELVGAALVRLEVTLGARPVVLDLPPDLPLVSIDGVLFEQVLTNLIENAHKYSADGLPIEIHAAIAGTTLRLEVADRGPGLPSGEEIRVFEKFHRGSNTRAVPGAGLGLSICQGIVEAHGGTISAANRDGGGATFTVRLPLEGEPPIVEQERGASATAGAS